MDSGGGALAGPPLPSSPSPSPPAFLPRPLPLPRPAPPAAGLRPPPYYTHPPYDVPRTTKRKTKNVNEPWQRVLYQPYHTIYQYEHIVVVIDL